MFRNLICNKLRILKNNSILENTVVVGKTVVPGFLYLIMLNGTFSVDSFFCIGGILVAYLTLKQVYKSSSMNFIPIMYLKRYLRLVCFNKLKRESKRL